ncbi:MAG: hypothetical protein ABJA66_07800 [Actinomycetota bacterium]
MNRFKNLMTVFAFSLLVLGLPTLASAQWTDRDNDTYNRNGRNNRNYDNGNLKSTVERLKNQSRDFDRQLERELKRNRNDRYNNNQILRLSEDFKDAADKLEDNFGSGRNLNNTQDEAGQVLQLGSQLENALYSSRSNYNLQGNWNQIHQDLNTIADAYGYNNNNRNNRNNRNRNGNWRDKVPFPLPF